MSASSAPASDDRILSVVELTQALRATLQDAFPGVWVRGEVSGLKRAESGHLYFALKEGRDAKIDCAMFRNMAMRMSFDLRDGQEVEAFGGVDVYAPRGNYQLIVRSLRPAGLGALLLQLEELKRRLRAEGLFEESRKRPLPAFPRRIGLVTSPVGAAVRDMIKVLRQRWPGIGIVLAPVRVQGEGSAAEIAAAIERFGRWGGVDVLLVGRGGGSIEDLWSFNEEVVVRAIAASPIPVVSAVGHEVDTTLADFAADVRAATPSHAAELVVREAAEVRARTERLRLRAEQALRGAVRDRRRGLERLLEHYGFRRVRDLFDRLQQRVDESRARLDLALRGRLAGARADHARLTRAYGLREALPARMRRERQALTLLRRALRERTLERMAAARRRVLALEGQLRALSPESVLERGYALVRTDAGTLVRSVEGLAVGAAVTLQFAHGQHADARIERVGKGEP